MNVPTLARSDCAAAVITVVACPVVAAAVAYGSGKLVVLAAVGVFAAAVGVYVGLRHPLWLFWGLAIALSALPFGYFPGVHVPLYLPFLGGALLAAVIHPTAQRSRHPLELAIWLLIAVSTMSVVVTAGSAADWTAFVRWTLCTLLVIALLRLSQRHMAKFGRIFVYASTINASFGLAMIAAGPSHRLMRYLAIFDYDRVETARYVIGDAGRSRIPRLGGTWVDPNAAGIAFGLALVLGIALLRGRIRVASAAILSAAILLTLSRAAIFSVLVGVLLVLLFNGMRREFRHRIVVVLALAAVVAIAVPSIRNRILSSFGSDDFGAADRGEALAAWPRYMSGHWFFGLGWGRREFIDGDYSFKFNIVANAPLIAAYRGGMIVGIVFVILLIAGCVVAFRLLRSPSLPAASFGAVFIGYCVVALQLDHPVVHLPQLVMTFSVFLAFLVFFDRERTISAIDDEHAWVEPPRVPDLSTIGPGAPPDQGDNSRRIASRGR